MSRNQSLDVLRGIAVLLVLGSHHFLLAAGWIGVDLFFVLSGFLISGLLFSNILHSGTITIKRFLIRRGLKIYPAYYVFLCITAVFSPAVRSYFWRALCFVQNYTFLHPVPDTIPATIIWRNTWSLAVEEHFYIVLPLLLLVLNRWGKLHWIPLISLSLIIGCFVMRVSYLKNLPHPGMILYQTHLRIDALFAGVALGYVWHFHHATFVRWSRRFLLPLGIMLLIPAIAAPSEGSYSVPMLNSLVCTANIIGFSLILIWAATRKLRGGAGIAKIGTYSYSIYLWQMPISYISQGSPVAIASSLIAFAAPYLPKSVLLSIVKHHFVATAVFGLPALLIGSALAMAASIVLGIMMAKLVELPVLNLRERLFPSPQRGHLLGPLDQSFAFQFAARESGA